MLFNHRGVSGRGGLIVKLHRSELNHSPANFPWSANILSAAKSTEEHCETGVQKHIYVLMEGLHKDWIRHINKIMKRNIQQKIFLLILLFALAPGLTACKWAQKRELSRNREMWQAQNITNYRYKVSIISYWGANSLMPLTMEYRSGQLVSVVDKDGNVQELGWDSLSGIEAIFQEVDTSLARKRRDVEAITYDPTYGFPTSIEIYYHETGVGGEYTRRYTIDHFEVLPDP